MISKNFFWKQCKVDAKRQWPLYLISFGLHLVTLVFGVSMLCYQWKTESLQQLVDGRRQDYLSDICYMVCGGNGVLSLIAMVLGFAFALQAFAWINKSSQIDFYNSLPVRKSHRFWSLLFTNGVGYLSGLFVCQVLSLMIVGINGLWTVSVLAYAVFGIVIGLLIFMATFGLTLIAVMLTGNSLLAFLGGGFFLALEPLAQFLGACYIEGFYESVYEMAPGGVGPPLLFTPFAGIWKLYRLCGGPLSRLYFEVALMMLIQMLVFLAIAYWLYQKRPALNGDKQMIFRASKPIIKVVILTVMALVSGWMIFQFQYQTPRVGIWGVLIGLVVMQVLVQSLMDGTIRHCAKGWKSFLVASVLSVCIFCFFAYDWIGYDSKIPEREKLESISVNMNGYMDAGGIDDDGAYRYGNECTIENVRIKDERTIELIRGVLQEAKDANQDHKISREWSDTGEELSSLNVKYQYKNGHTSYRTYRLTYGELYHIENVLVENPDYRKCLMNFSAKGIQKVGHKLRLYYKDSIDGSVLLSNSNAEVIRLVEMAEQDYLKRDGRIEVSQAPVGQLELQVDGKAAGQDTCNIIYIPIYARDSNMMDYLGEKGVVAQIPFKEDSIGKIVVERNHAEEAFTINQGDECMKELLPQLHLQFEGESTVRRYGYSETDYRVYVYDTNGNNMDCYIKKGGVPKDFDSHFVLNTDEVKQ